MKRALCFLCATAVFAAVLALPSVRSSARLSGSSTAFPRPALDDSIAPAKGQQVAVVSGGCFWGVQAVFAHVRGVIAATSGYAGGTEDTAHYEMVGTGQTGHAESVKVVFDPSQITYGQLLMVFFSVAHNPTELNKQGPDWGSQYRSSIFYSNDGQKRIAEAYIAQLNSAKVFSQQIVTVIVPLREFYAAEEYHQDYVKHHPNNPYIMINDLPKLNSLKKQFPEMYREQ
jgi:peptide-methionine (S)-S-oxide reductase